MKVWLGSPHIWSPMSYFSCSYWSWQGAAVSVVLVCCLTAFNILCRLTVCHACVQGVSLWKKMPPDDLLGNNEAISWLRVGKNPLPPSFAGLCPLQEVQKPACCAKCLWSVITDRECWSWPVFLLIWRPAAQNTFSFIIGSCTTRCSSALWT